MNTQQCTLTVRDYELDAQDVVNHAHYLHYYEHARHQYLTSYEIDFFSLCQQGYALTIIDFSVQYNHPLVSGDNFIIETTLTLSSKIRINSQQQIYLSDNHTLISSAKGTYVCLQLPQRKPIPYQPLIDILQQKI